MTASTNISYLTPTHLNKNIDHNHSHSSPYTISESTPDFRALYTSTMASVLQQSRYSLIKSLYGIQLMN